ncbi:superoxide dismutase [Craurococcus roseus]|uniref:Superoxide dismutase n=1 Tax=Craurococcus roseus TaxID=77585 RepID=A0ABP3PMC3_9PROT
MHTMSRRQALFLGGAAALAAAVPLPRAARAQQAPSGPFTLPPLPYGADANEPHIDAQTMQLHHGRHHQAYVTNLNNALRDHAQLAQQPIERILASLNEVPEAVRTAVRNNGGGHANHAMFWEIMGGKGGAPSGELAQAIERDLGGFDKMKTDFNAMGGRVFGSGWVFVTVDRTGKLALASRPNQDTPLMDGGRVLIGNDVWEHAYYLKYQNRRPEYLSAWWNVVNWDRVAARYAAAKAGTLAI